MKFHAVSTFNRAGLDLYGRRMVETFREHWPAEVGLTVYSEGWDDLPGSEVIDLHDASPWLAEFKARNANRPEPKDFRWDAVRFAHKVAAVCHAAKESDTDCLIWLDGDVVTHADVTTDDLTGLAPAFDEWISWLDRVGNYPECGFYMLNCDHPDHDGMIWEFESLYISDRLFDLEQWHDSFVLQKVVEWGEIETHSLSGDASGTSHPLVNGPLGAWFDHLKGHRKHEGRSRRTDLQRGRAEAYWQ